MVQIDRKESVNVLNECVELQLKKSKDYQSDESSVLQAMHYRRGVDTIHDIIIGKLMRATSLLEAGNNPNFVFYCGHTYLLDNSANVSSHPLQIRTSNGGSAFTTGVTENFNSTTGLTQFIVPHNISDTSLVYQCTNHSAMVGNITIV
mgnify:CR=1 FL=1